MNLFLRLAKGELLFFSTEVTEILALPLFHVDQFPNKVLSIFSSILAWWQRLCNRNAG
jgi:hypothetical protein